VGAALRRRRVQVLDVDPALTSPETVAAEIEAALRRASPESRATQGAGS
jgi:hypothetical protein